MRFAATADALRRDFVACALALCALLLWEAGGLDLRVLHAFGDAAGFAWRNHWLTRGLMHDGGRALGWLVLMALAVNLRWPLPFARDLRAGERLHWFAVTLACTLAIVALKRASLTSCPWALAEFGGSARFVPHWALGVHDGGPGGCFPSGHASSAFAFLSGWFALRERHPRAARRWFAATLGCGLLFGLAQTMRGAHPPSHTLWTAWICFAICAVSRLRLERRRIGDARIGKA